MSDYPRAAQPAIDSNARTNHLIRILAVVTSLSLIATGLLTEYHGQQQRTIILDCTTAGPHKPTAAKPTTGHRCFDESSRRTGEVITDLRRSIDCVALYAIKMRPPACAEVDARMDALRAGEDPFAPPQPKGTP